jgi:SRSO17 transposase
VKVAHDDGTDPSERAPQWLVIEWLDGESKPSKFYLTTLRRRMSKKQLVRTIKERWKTERAYQELKGELGFDHFEGRSFLGWHHHVSVVLCCYAFVVAERVRAFSPSARRSRRHHAVVLAA